VKFGSPASIAGLPGESACVNVGPPLLCNGPSIGLVLIWSLGPVRYPLPSSLLRLYPSDTTVPKEFTMFAPGPPEFRIVFANSVSPVPPNPPTFERLDPLPDEAEFPLSVVLLRLSVPLPNFPPVLTIPPPAPEFAEFPLMVLLVTCRSPSPKLLPSL